MDINLEYLLLSIEILAIILFLLTIIPKEKNMQLLKKTSDWEKRLKKKFNNYKIQKAKKITYQSIKKLYFKNRMAYYFGILIIIIILFVIRNEVFIYQTVIGSKIKSLYFGIVMIYLVIKVIQMFIIFEKRGELYFKSIVKGELGNIGFNNKLLSIVMKWSKVFAWYYLLGTLPNHLTNWKFLISGEIIKFNLWLVAIYMIKELLIIMSKKNEQKVSRVLTYIMLAGVAPEATIGSYPFNTYDEIVASKEKELRDAFAESFDADKIKIVKVITSSKEVIHYRETFSGLESINVPIRIYQFELELQGIPSVWKTFNIQYMERAIINYDVKVAPSRFEVFISKLKKSLKLN